MKKRDSWKKQTNNSSLFPKKKNVVKHYRKASPPVMSRKMKQIIVAICSSLVIGMMLGLFTLQMSKQENQQDAAVVNSSTTDEQDEGNLRNIDSIQVYVVQGGVFSEEENIKEWEGKFNNLQFPTQKWKRGNEFYLLTGVSGSLETANKLAKEMDEQGLDAFVKEWETAEASLNVTSADYKWLLLFREQLLKSLDSVDNGNGLLEDDWQELTEQINGLSPQVQGFQEVVQHSIEAVNTAESTRKEMQLFLLQLLHDYEQITNTK